MGCPRVAVDVVLALYQVAADAELLRGLLGWFRSKQSPLAGSKSRRYKPIIEYGPFSVACMWYHTNGVVRTLVPVHR